MKLRPLGSSGLLVSEISLGGWQLASPAWGTQDSKEALRIVRTALDGGCNFFDTAPGYGGGLSETLLGRALRSCRSNVVLCTKFGHPANGPSDFSVPALRPSIESSMKRLQTSYLDVLLVHNPPAEWLDGRCNGLYAELERLKQAGLLRHYGVSVDTSTEMLTAMHTTGSTVIEVLFNVFQQDALACFGEAGQRGVGLVAKVPLDSGWLSGKYRRDSRFIGVRERWPASVIARRAALVDRFAELLPPGVPIAHAALRYILAYPQVSTVIPGARSAQQVLENLKAADAPQPLDDSVVKAIHALWQREIQAAPLPW
jgi:aryl-alcohol dehydrogenase-like predicted oxidoreductase